MDRGPCGRKGKRFIGVEREADWTQEKHSRTDLNIPSEMCALWPQCLPVTPAITMYLCTSRYGSPGLDSRPRSALAGIQLREIPHVTEPRALANGQAVLSLLFADIDQLITISGMVIRTSQLIPEMQEAFFQCQVCAHTAQVEIDRGRIAEPCACERCHTTHSMALIHNRSVFSDKQMVCGLPGCSGWTPLWHVLPLFCLNLDP